MIFVASVICKPKVLFRFFNKLKYKIRIEVLTDVEPKNIKLNGFSILKIIEHQNSNSKFVFFVFHFNL